MTLAKLFSRKNTKLRQYIKIKQDKETIEINGLLSNAAYQVKQLVFYLRGDDRLITIPNMKSDYQFYFNFDIHHYAEQFNIEEGIYNVAINVRVHRGELTEKQLINLKTKSTTKIDTSSGYVEYLIRLGRFNETITEQLIPANIKDNKFELYKTVKGNLAFSVNHPVDQPNKMQMNYLKPKRNHLEFGGKLFTRSLEIEEIELLITGRTNNKEVYFPVDIYHFEEQTKRKFGLNRYRYSVAIPLRDVFQDPDSDSDIYDFYFKVKYRYHDESVFLKVGKPRFRARYRIKSCILEDGQTIFSVAPYYTFRYSNLSLQADAFDKETYHYLKKVMRWAFFIRQFNKKRDIWLVGERAHKSQDTGYHFFKYMRTAYPDKEVYYVIKEDSPDIKNVEQYGNVIYFKSKEHIKYNLIATKIIASHHPDYLYPIRTREFMKKVGARLVFLQHGVLGTKNMNANYGKNAPGFHTNLFLVSSEFEKSIVVNDFGYNENEVAITGLSRFDSLFQDDVTKKRQLLIIPTWREWLLREEIFLESEYLERYKELIFHPQLQQLAEKYQFNIVFCLHPNMQKYTHFFEGAPVNIINQDETNVQRLLKESAMMLTDYSSVAFDFSFLEKPIIYYQFDRRRFIGAQGSHIDLDRDLPGDITYKLEGIFPLIEEYAQRNFQMSPENKDKVSKFLTYRDKQNSERIYQAVNQELSGKSIGQIIMHSELYKALYNRFRKSKYYFKIMKLFYRLAIIIIPVNKKVILFESGVGKQLTDSPRIIYEEIVNRGMEYKKVWVYNKHARFSDVENTIRIKRLSPSYYYYLARAKVWVNNQNFPTYLKKRKGTTYIQSWHGTPLKKMLHDIEHVMGRSDTYLDRVSNAIKNWDYLISPSPYASKAFRSAFKYKGEILETGYPRNDIFYMPNQHELMKQVKSHLHLPEDKKVILYAPTFRDNQTSKSNHFTFDMEMDLHKMRELLGEDYVILLRMHVVIKNKIKIDEQLDKFVINVSDYPDMQELLMISDVLITDYSSVMFDFANTCRPILYFTYDLELYRDSVRGFYMDFEQEAPGPFLKNTDEIIDAIQKLPQVQKEYQYKYDAFYEKYCGLEDGKASERIIQHLLDKGILK